MRRKQNVKRNPFHKSLIELFENVAQISHVASVSEKIFSSQISQAEKLIKECRLETRIGPVLGTSTSLPVAAIHESTNVMRYHSYGSIDSFDDRLLGTTRECELRLYDELLCGAFEEAELFLHQCFAIASFQPAMVQGNSVDRWGGGNAKTGRYSQALSTISSHMQKTKPITS